MTKAAAAVAVGKDVRGGGDLFLYGVVVNKTSLCIFSILMSGKEAVCLDGLFVTAIFQESGFYLNSLKCHLDRTSHKRKSTMSENPKTIIKARASTECPTEAPSWSVVLLTYINFPKI
jgi:hypothetical protein